MDRLTGVSKNVDGNNISNSYTYDIEAICMIPRRDYIIYKVYTITQNGEDLSMRMVSLEEQVNY